MEYFFRDQSRISAYLDRGILCTILSMKDLYEWYGLLTPTSSPWKHQSQRRKRGLRSVKYSESSFIRAIKNKVLEPDPQYVHELNVLRAMVRQEDRQGDIGWGGSWTKERYQNLKEKHPEAVMAFEREIRQEKEREQHRRETLEKHRHSPYIEEVEGWPTSEAKDHYLKDLKQLRDVMIHSNLGYIGYAGGAILGALRSKYPQAHEAFEKELADL